MNNFQLSSNIDTNKVFLCNRSELEGRWDPVFYTSFYQNFIQKTPFPTLRLNQIIISAKSGFGAGKNDQVDDLEQGAIHIRPTNIDKEGQIIVDKCIFVPVKDNEDIIELEDVLFNNTNSQELVGKTGLYNNDQKRLIEERLQINDLNKLYFSNHITRLRVDKEKISSSYLWLILNFYQQKKVFYALCTNWNNQSGIGLDLLNTLKIPVPSLKKQEKLALYLLKSYEIKQQKEQEAQAILDSIDDYLMEELGIELPEIDKSLENRIFMRHSNDLTKNRWDGSYHSYFKFILGQSFKYQLVSLKSLIDITPQYGLNDSAIDPNSESDIRFIRITDIDNKGNLKPDNWKTVHNPLPQYYLEKDDILFARSGSVGRCYIHQDLSRKAVFAGYLIRFKVNAKKINPLYLFYYCNTYFYKKWVEAIERPSVQSNINAQEFMSLPVILPDMQKQNEIVSHIQSIRNKAEKLQKEAHQQLEDTKKEIERMILGESQE